MQSGSETESEDETGAVESLLQSGSEAESENEIEEGKRYVNNVEIPAGYGEQQEIVDGKWTGRYTVVPISDIAEAEYKANIKQAMLEPKKLQEREEYLARLIEKIEDDEESDEEDASDDRWVEAADEQEYWEFKEDPKGKFIMDANGDMVEVEGRYTTYMDPEAEYPVSLHVGDDVEDQVSGEKVHDEKATVMGEGA